jgi:hypothetical protein
VTFLQLKNRVRKRTQHILGDPRLDEPTLEEICNDVIRELRTELITIAPTYGLCTSPTHALTAGQKLGLEGVEHVHRLEYLNDTTEDWDPVARADEEVPSQHMGACMTWERRGQCVVLHPEGDVTGSFRMLYHPLLSDLTLPAEVVPLPASLNKVAVYRGSAEVTGGIDRKDPKGFLDLAKFYLDLATPVLANEYGVHTHYAGFRTVLGY